MCRFDYNGATQRPSVKNDIGQFLFVDKGDQILRDCPNGYSRKTLVGTSTTSLIKGHDAITSVDDAGRHRIPNPATHPPTVSEHHCSLDTELLFEIDALILRFDGQIAHCASPFLLPLAEV